MSSGNIYGVFDPYEFIKFVCDMGGFSGYRPEVSKAIVLMCLCLAFSSFMFLAMLGMNIRDRAKRHKLNLDESTDDDPAYIYAFSENGLLKIYPDGCVISISGANISSKLYGIARIKWLEDENGDTASVVCRDSGYRTDTSPIREDIRLGKLEPERRAALERYLLQYAGG